MDFIPLLPFSDWGTKTVLDPEAIEETEALRPLDPEALIPLVGKFRPRLIELTSFKLKLLIRFIMNILVKTNKHQNHVKQSKV